MVEIGVSVLKGISGNKHTTNFVLCDRDSRVHLLHSIIDRLPTDVQRRFIIDKYTDEYENFPCISCSASGESTNSIVVVYFSLVVVYSSLVVVYSSLVCLQLWV